MVKKIEKDGKPLYVCEICGFAYRQQKWAEQCEKWCGERHSCNLDIARHAVKMD